MRRFVVLGAILLAAGCAPSISMIMTGKPRTAIGIDAVKIYSTPPARFEDIAMVTAQANSGWTAQGETDNVIAGLKQKAAQVGANGVLIESSGKSSDGAMALPNGAGGFLIADASSLVLKCRLIYVLGE